MQDVGGTAVAITDESHCLHSYLLAKVDTDELWVSLLIGQQTIINDYLVDLKKLSHK